MKYYKWDIHFEEGSNEGTVPSVVDGAFQEGLTIYGYGNSDLDTIKYSKWNLEEISQSEILNKFNNLNNLNCSVGEDGKIKMPHPNGIA